MKLNLTAKKKKNDYSIIALVQLEKESSWDKSSPQRHVLSLTAIDEEVNLYDESSATSIIFSHQPREALCQQIIKLYSPRYNCVRP